MSDSVQKIIVMSDIHLTDGEKIIGLDPVSKLKSALNHALRTHSDAEQIVFTGDLTHDGTLEQYSILKEITQAIKMPITYMIGNHDKRDVFAKVFPSVLLDCNGFLQSAISYKTHRLLFLDTVHAQNSPNDRDSGYLCPKRLKWIENELEASNDKNVVIFMHHPAFEVGFGAMDKIRLVNENQFFASLDKYKNVDHIIAGHIHRTISGSARGYGFSVFKSTCHQMPLMLESHNVKLSAIEPPAYGIILLKDSSVVIHSEEYELGKGKTIIFEDYS